MMGKDENEKVEAAWNDIGRAVDIIHGAADVLFDETGDGNTASQVRQHAMLLDRYIPREIAARRLELPT